MKTTILIILSVLLSSIVLAQNPLLEYEAGHIQTDQLYGLKKWTEAELKDIPEAIAPTYSEGGVLVEDNEFYLVEDSIWINDISGVPDSMLLTKWKSTPSSPSHYLMWECGIEYQDIYLFENLLLRDSIQAEDIFLFKIMTIPQIVDDGTELALNPIYKDNFPNGLPKKLVHRKFIKKKPIRWLSLSEWEIYKQGKNITQLNEQIYIGGEKANYWYFPAGYYAWWDRMMVENTPVTTYQIKKALIERGYDLELDNIFDSKTKAALTRFIKDNNIPTSCMAGGHINVLKALGVSE